MKLLKIAPLFLGLIIITGGNVSAQNPPSPGKFCSMDIFPRVDFTAKVLNNTKSTINLYFVNYDTCEEFRDRPVFTAKPGETINVDGQNGRAYRVREAGTNKILKEISMDPKTPNITITAGAPPSNLPPPTDEVIYVFKNKANVTNCTPNPGWAKCIQMPEPTIRIMATKAVSQSAMNGVANVYAEMMRRLSPKYPKNKLDTFIVHMTNAEPWSELINLAPIGMAYPQSPYESSGDWLRGYGNPDNLWITEQMICKQGVATRNARKPNSDNTNRLFDQVVHEFGHSLHSNLLTDQIVNSTFKFPNGPTNWLTPLESFPYRLQQWFRTPNLDHVAVSPKEESFLKGFFTARATFSCDGYKP